MSKSELLDFCLKKGVDRETAETIVQYVFESGDQNQLMYEDYERMVRESKFDLIFFKGYDTELQKSYTTSDFLEIMAALKKKYPRNDNFLYEGITMLVRKPKA